MVAVMAVAPLHPSIGGMTLAGRRVVIAIHVRGRIG